MMVSAAACSICWIVIAISQGRVEAGGNSKQLGSLAVAFFFVFWASFGMGVLGVPWYDLPFTSGIRFQGHEMR